MSIFAYSSRLAVLTLALALHRDQDRDQAQDLAAVLALDRDLAQVRVLNREQAANRGQVLDRVLALDQVLDRVPDRVPHRDLVWAQVLDRALHRALHQDQGHLVSRINDDPYFHAATIHIATLLELSWTQREVFPPYLTYSLLTSRESAHPCVRAAHLFHQFLNQESTLDEETEFQQLLNIDDEELRPLFDLAYFTDPDSRKPIFRFHTS